MMLLAVSSPAMLLAETVAPAPPLPTSWVTLAGFVSVLAFQAWNTRQASRIKGQVTNGGTNLAVTVGQIKEHLVQIDGRLAALERNPETGH